MKVIVFCDEGLIYTIPDKLYNQYKSAYKKDDIGKMVKLEKKMSLKYQPVFADFVVTDTDK
jgi:hypothetical protein